MTSASASAISKPPAQSRSRRIRYKLLLFSLFSASATSFIAAAVFYVTSVYLPARELQELNEKTLNTIHCTGPKCDVSGVANDWEFSGSDYLIDKYTRFFLSLDEPAANLTGFVLHRSDPAFMARFNPAAASFATPADESWRLLSTTGQCGSRRLAVMVGYAERASWKMNLPSPAAARVDSQLQEQLRKLVGILSANDGKLESLSAPMRKISLDGYEVVDVTNHEILSGGYWLPVYFPEDLAFPATGSSLRLQGADLCLVRIDASDRLLTASAQLVGNLWSLIALVCLVFLASGMTGYTAANRFLRKYLVFGQLRPCEVQNAVELGEGTSIEFKRGVSLDTPNLEQILQTVAAFANTDDGTLFIGIDDDTKIKGLRIENPKQKDQFAQKVHQVVRHRIKPAPWIYVDFPVVREFTVCRIFVPRGEEPLYYLDGVIYVRYGSADVTAEPDIVKHLLARYAF